MKADTHPEYAEINVTRPTFFSLVISTAIVEIKNIAAIILIINTTIFDNLYVFIINLLIDKYYFPSLT